MLIPGHRVPFFIDDLYSGLARANGLLGLRGDALLLEFQTQDNLVGLFKGRSGQVQIPFNEIYKIEIVKKLFSRQLVIRPNSLAVLEKIPGAESEARLKIKRQDMTAAKEIVSYINLRISELRLDALDEPGEASL